MEIRFAVLLPAKLNKEAANIAKKVARLGPHRFVVDNKHLFPYITLFKINVHKRNYLRLEKIVSQAVQTSPKLSLTVRRIGSPKDIWVDLEITPTRHLAALRKKLADVVSKSGYADKVMIKARFRPHITLTRFYSTKHVAKIAQLRQRVLGKFTASTIALCLSRQTQVYRIISKHNLK